MERRESAPMVGLYVRGFVQVFLVTAQTWLIAHEAVAGVFVVGLGISLLWTFNVRSAAFGTNGHRFSYSLGAATGAVIGLITARWLVSQV